MPLRDAAMLPLLSAASQRAAEAAADDYAAAAAMRRYADMLPLRCRYLI